MLVRVGSLGCVTKRCEHCGKIYFSFCPDSRFCSTECRRGYQDERRIKERLDERKRRIIPIRFCPVCGKPKRDFSAYENEGKTCSPCCAAIRKRRAELGLPDIWHKPNYALALNLASVMPDPWKEGRLPEEVTGNALDDGGMGMPEEIDDIEYYRLKIASLYDSSKYAAQTQKAVPSPAEPEKTKKQKRRGKRCRHMHR